MNPLEIFQKTPKSNCGKCGHPTCLAYAAAVAKMGEDPRSCPSIDPGDFPDVTPTSTKIEDLAREKDLALVQHLKSKIDYNRFQAIATPLGARWSPGTATQIAFRYLAQDIVVNPAGITIDGNEPEDPRDQILLYNYISSGGGEFAHDSWIGLESLPNSISKVRTLAQYGEKPIAALFNSFSPEEVASKCQKHLDAEEVPSSSASIALLFTVLPKLPIQVHFWAEDLEDGFEASVKILFTADVLDFLDIESLVFAVERLADHLQERLA